MPLKLLIFDLDGTLVDTGKDITEALNFAVNPYGIPPLTVEEAVGLIGEGITRLIEKVLGGKSPKYNTPVLERFLFHYSKNLTKYSAPYPNVTETLQKLQGTAKVVLSNKRTDFSVSLLEALGLAEHFDLIAGSDFAPEKKPSPVPVLSMLKKFGTGPEEAVIIGDSDYDIISGKAAGVRTVAVTYGYRPREVLKDADYVIDSFEELIPLLTKHSSMLERRREKRYAIPEVFSRYILMKVKISEDYFPVQLLDFSKGGFRMKCPVPFDVGSLRDCLVSAPKSLSREISLTARISHCMPGGRGKDESQEFYIAGAEITSVDDALWFRVLENTIQFISERSGVVY